MTGLWGSDTCIVDDLGDVVIEKAADKGNDTVIALVSGAVLSANVDNLTLEDEALTGAGNELANILKGNSEANTLSGEAGDDTLDGGLGTDRLIGGSGNDTYIIDTLQDVIV